MKPTREEIIKLKQMTMKPPIYAEDMLTRIEAELMFGEPKGFYKMMLEKQRDSLKVQIQVDLIPIPN